MTETWAWNLWLQRVSCLQWLCSCNSLSSLTLHCPSRPFCYSWSWLFACSHVVLFPFPLSFLFRFQFLLLCWMAVLVVVMHMTSQGQHCFRCRALVLSNFAYCEPTMNNISISLLVDGSDAVAAARLCFHDIPVASDDLLLIVWKLGVPVIPAAPNCRRSERLFPMAEAQIRMFPSSETVFNRRNTAVRQNSTEENQFKE